MEHPLPARPSFLPPRPGTTPSIPASADAGPSRLPPISAHVNNPSPLASSSKPIITCSPNGGCVICSNPPKYTCPRCSTKTCSLPCSKAHKTQESCSGVRDPAAFVSLKEYGQGVWSDDYKWLEEGRRKVGGWGQGIKVEEVPASFSSSSTLNNKGRGDRQTQMQLRNRRGKKVAKVDGLKRELEKRGCSVYFMPEGMAKRKNNQSNWNPKSQQLYLTMHLQIPTHLLDADSSSDSLKNVNHQRVLFASPASTSTALPTLVSLLPETIDANSIVTLLSFHSMPSQPAPEHALGQKLFYPPLDPSKTLNEALRGTAWVEFPVIQIMERTKWEEGLKQGDMVVVPLVEPMLSVRDAGWGKRKAVAQPMADVRSDDIAEEGAKDSMVASEAKRVKVDDDGIIGSGGGGGGGGGEGLMALGDYVSDDDDKEEEEEDGNDVSGGGDVDLLDGHEGASDDEVDPPIEVLQAVGAALIADLGEAA
ncbi:hypothetical protein IAT40_005562 [Kwoniella sp. CBS 6097]